MSDGITTDEQQIVVNVTNVNEAPVLTGLDNVTFAENTVNAAAQLIDSNVSLTDPDAGDYAGGSITVSYAASGLAQDNLSIRNQGTGAGQIGLSGNDVTYGGVVIGTLTSAGAAGANLVVTLNANSTKEAVDALIENLTYRNSSNHPDATRTINISVNDGDGGTASASAVITVNAETEPFAQNDRFISGDGDLDAIISGGSGNAWVLTNSNGDLSFASSVTAGGGTSFDVALGDFDGDGDLDALVSKEFGGAAFVMTNDGNGSFTTATLATNVNSTGVAAGDLNGDGRADAIVSASNGLGSQDHTIYLSNASGVLTASGTLPTAINSSEVALGDVDGDGDLDAVISAYDAEPEVWRNDGAGAFTQVSGQQVGAEEWNDVELADFNRDGHLDAVFAHANNGTIVIAYGDGTGVFGAVKTTMALGIGEGRDADVADLNGDGLLDIYVGGRTNDVALINNGLIDPNTPPSFTGYGFAGGGDAVELGDLDGDGDIDVVKPRDNADVVRVGYNTGNGQGFNFQNENAPSFNLGIFGAALGDVQGARSPTSAIRSMCWPMTATALRRG